MTSVRAGAAGSFAGYALHRSIDAPAPFERWLASPDDDLDALVVVTALRAAHAAEELEQAIELADLFAAEARIKRDGVVPVREIGQAEGQPFIVHHYVGAVTAEALIARRRVKPDRVPATVGATIVHGAVDVLRGVHESGGSHGALLPGHVLVDGGGDVWITGFAESHFLAAYGEQAPDDKAWPPEHRRVREPSGPGSPCYGVGALFFQLLTGKAQPDEWEPRWAGIMMEMSMSGVPGDALQRVVTFCHRALAERSAQRFQSIGKLARAWGPVSIELEAPAPRMRVANCVRDMLPPIVRIDREAEPAFTIGDADLAAYAADAAAAPAPAPVVRREPAQHTRVGGVESIEVAARALTPEPTEAGAAADAGGGPRNTRILGHSNPSLRSLAPELREQIGPHPLEILARTRYQVLGELGTGGTGTVYKILDTTLSEILALKVLRTELTNDAAWLQRFKRELMITRDLEHPHILPAYHLEQVDGLYFFTMRYVDGETLYETVRQNGGLDLGVGVPVMVSVGEALAAAHDRGIVHRDFKSANVMIERVTAHPYLMDFGIALTPDNPGLTITGQGIGTPVYMAPEQAMGDTITELADIYSFGVVLYQTFSGALPFKGTTTVAIYTAQVQSTYPKMAEIAPGLPGALGALIDRCLAPKPEDRPASMSAVVEALRALSG